MKTTVILAFCLLAVTPAFALNKMDRVSIRHIQKDIDVGSFDERTWLASDKVEIASYWSGETAPAPRRLEARLVWSDSSLYVRFEAEQHEPLIVSDKPDLTKKAKGLWDRDVCEIFIAPDRSFPNKYFEFEVAPTGEWIDLAIEVTPAGRRSDLEYASGMQTAAKIRGDKIIAVMKIPFKALGRTPKVGEIWLGNLFRCIGSDGTRGYLAWRPTRTSKPNFHVPSAFGEFQFVQK